MEDIIASAKAGNEMMGSLAVDIEQQAAAQFATALQQGRAWMPEPKELSPVD